MDDLIGDVVYNKFLIEKIEVQIKGAIVERLLGGCEIFIKYLQEELPYTMNPCLKNDIDRMTRIFEGLRNFKNRDKAEVTFILTIAEFLIFKYGLERVSRLVGSFDLSDALSIAYMDFIIYMDEIYGTLNENDINEYYSFLASFDEPQVTGGN